MIAGCRGYRTETPPFHLNPNMDWQAKYKAQQLSLPIPEDTVAQGTLKDDPVFFEGKDASGKWVRRIPLDVTKEFMLRGQERYDIYCAVCHDRAGTGKGPVVQRGFVPPPDFADDRLLAYPDGQLFDVISHGIRNMPAYGKQIPESDRWAIVAYLRAIQKSRTTKVSELPADMKTKIGPKPAIPTPAATVAVTANVKTEKPKKKTGARQ